MGSLLVVLYLVYVALNLFAVAPSSEPCPVNPGLGSHRDARRLRRV
jgi:hypothetical protein